MFQHIKTLELKLQEQSKIIAEQSKIIAEQKEQIKEKDEQIEETNDWCGLLSDIKDYYDPQFDSAETPFTDKFNGLLGEIGLDFYKLEDFL